MDYLITFEDGSSGYLSHYGVKGMKWGVWNEETKQKYGQAANSFQGGGGGMLDEDAREDSETAKDAKSEAAAAIDALLHAPQKVDEAISTARKKIDEWGSHLPQNPLYDLKKRTEEAEASGESDAARRRLEERYSHENVLGKTKTKQFPPPSARKRRENA